MWIILLIFGPFYLRSTYVLLILRPKGKNLLRDAHVFFVACAKMIALDLGG